MNICLAVGPKDAAVVRYTCLRKNYRYLHYVLERNARAGRGIATNAKTSADVHAWMAINTDWRDDPVVGRVTREDAEGATSVVVILQAILAAMRDNGIPTDDDLAPVIFRNPAVAIEFGLVDVLKHLVEQVGIDINATIWSNFTRDAPFHLLIQAILHEESACLEYLLSTEKIDMNSHITSDRTHALKVFILGYDGTLNEHFRAIVRYPTFGVNAPMNVAGGLSSPLVFMCLSAGAGEAPMSPKHAELIQVILDEGADPTLQIGDNLSPLAFASFAASRENVEATREDKAVWKEIVRMMERKVESLE